MAACPVCKSESAAFSWQYDQHSIFQCPRCQVQFVHPMTSGSLEYYQSCYGEVMSSITSGDVHPGFRFTSRMVRRTIQRYLGPDRRKAIDVGCGPGFMLAELERQGLYSLGIDFNPDMVRIANEHFHVHAQVGRVEDLLAVQSRFDLALLIHVLEHVQDPAALLASIFQLLNPGGILVIDLPNRDRLAIRRSLKGGTFPSGDYPPHHLSFWSVASLAKALGFSGYTVLECFPRPYGEEDQIFLFLTHHLKFVPQMLARPLASSLRLAGRMARLQGDTVFAVARRPG